MSTSKSSEQYWWPPASPTGKWKKARYESTVTFLSGRMARPLTARAAK